MDKILEDIEFDENKTNDESINKAKELIYRLRKRDIYKCASYFLLKPSVFGEVKIIKYKKICNEWLDEIYNIILDNNTNTNINKNEIIVELMSLGYGMETKNPVENTLIYNSKQPNKINKLKLDQITILQSGNFKEIIFRVFVKNIKHKNVISKAVIEFVNLKKIVKGIRNIDYLSEHLSPQTKRNNDNYNNSINDNNIKTPPNNIVKIGIENDSDIDIKKNEGLLGKRTNVFDERPRHKKRRID